MPLSWTYSKLSPRWSRTRAASSPTRRQRPLLPLSRMQGETYLQSLHIVVRHRQFNYSNAPSQQWDPHLSGSIRPDQTWLMYPRSGPEYTLTEGFSFRPDVPSFTQFLSSPWLTPHSSTDSGLTPHSGWLVGERFAQVANAMQSESRKGGTLQGRKTFPSEISQKTSQ